MSGNQSGRGFGGEKRTVYGGIMRWMEKLAGRMDELEDR